MRNTPPPSRSDTAVKDHVESSRSQHTSTIWQWRVAICLSFFALVHMVESLSAVAPPIVYAHEIAILKSADIAAYNKALSTFKADLPKSVTKITEHNLEGQMSLGRKFARKLRASDARLVMAVGLKAALATKLEIFDIPVIFCMVLNPQKYELPTRNMTGIELKIPIQRQLETIQSILPTIERVGLVFDPTQTGEQMKEARRQAKRIGLTLVARPVTSEREVPSTLRALVSDIQALWLLPDRTVLNEDSLNFLLSTTLDRNVPLIGFSSGLVRSGALASIYIRYEDIGHQAATLAAKVLERENIPVGMVVPLDKVRISLNLKTAEFLHLSIPPEVLGNADETF